MIEGIGIALKSYRDTASGAKAILESAIAQINENYIGAMLAEKTKEAKEIYNSTLAESRKRISFPTVFITTTATITSSRRLRLSKAGLPRSRRCMELNLPKRQ